MSTTTTRSLRDLTAEEFYTLGDEIRAAHDSASAARSAAIRPGGDLADWRDLADFLDVDLTRSDEGRYEVAVNGVHVGWIVRPSRFAEDHYDRKLWRAFASRPDFSGHRTASAETRKEALDEFLGDIAIYGVTHVFGAFHR